MKILVLLMALVVLTHAGERPRLEQSGHLSAVTSVAFSPDGSRVLTAGSGDLTARIWNAATGDEIRRLEGHTGYVIAVAYAPDGRHVLTGSADRTARLWDAQTGREVRRFAGHGDAVWGVAFSPDGGRIATASKDRTARLWDAATARPLHVLKGHASAVQAIAFAPDGRRVATASSDGTARLWDTGTGRELARFVGHTHHVLAVTFTSQGRSVLTGGFDSTARLWDVESGRETRRFAHRSVVYAVAPAGKGRVATGCADGVARVWETSTAKEVRQFRGHVGYVFAVAASPDRRTLLTAGDDFTARLWEMETGKEIHRLGPHSAGAVWTVTFSPDGRRLLTGVWKAQAQLWDLAAGREVRRFGGPPKAAVRVFLTPDGRHVLTGGPNGTATLWDIETGRELRSYGGPHRGLALSRDGSRVLAVIWNRHTRTWNTWFWDVESGREIGRFAGPHDDAACFSPDGSTVLSASDRQAVLWDATTGKSLRRLGPHKGPVWAVAYAPDGKYVLTGGGVGDNVAILWDTATGKELRRFVGHNGAIHAVAFSPDGTLALTGSRETNARLWDVATGEELARFVGHAGATWAVAFSPDGKWVVTGSRDQTVRFWDPSTGKEACRLISFRGGTWAVVDAEGRYDASNGGAVKGLHWVVGNELISLEQLKERYYDPGLLAKLLGFSREPLRQVKAFTAPRLFPHVRVRPPAGGEATLGIHLVNRGGGIGRVVVKINGKELTADARSSGTDPQSAELQLEVPLAGDPRLAPGRPNLIEVEAYNAEGYLRSRGVQVPYVAAGKAADNAPELWAVVAGIADYAGESIDLRYAAKDAADFAAALRTAANRLFTKEKVHVTLLQDAGRAQLVAALEDAARARPSDILVVYLAGHGVSGSGSDGNFYYLTREARSAQLADPAVRAATAISSRELTELIKRIPARKQVLVVDTCAAGRLVERLTERRDVPSGQIRALQRLKDRTGVYVLAGCAADRVSYEASRYAQGLLTYSLLLGMRGAALRAEEYVDVARLLAFATDQVPRFASDIGGVQRPIVAVPRGGASFDLGRLTDQDRKQIPLRPVLPVFLRSNLQDEADLFDSLGLAKRVDAALDDLAAAGPWSGFVFVDARDLPEAYRIAGQYRVEGNRVRLRVRLIRGGERGEIFSLTGDARDLAALAAQVIKAARARLR